MNAKTFNPKVIMLSVAFASVVIIGIVIGKILPIIETILFLGAYVIA